MKYIIVPFIALGFVFSMAIGIEYSCVGDGVGPTYYGSPFVFKQKSLVTSLAYYYSVSGILLNVVVWSIFFGLLHFWVFRWIKKRSSPKTPSMIYSIIIGFLIVLSTLSIALETVFLQGQFAKGQHYWYFDMAEETEKWGMECESEWMFFRN